jgi:hypothetical protein
MRRRLLNLLTALSLLLCVAAGALWVRSRRVGDWLTHTVTDETALDYGRHVSEWAAFSGDGGIQLSRLSYTWGFGIGRQNGMGDGWGLRESGPKAGDDLGPWGDEFGFAFDVEESLEPVDDGGGTIALMPLYTAVIAFPHWFVVLLFAALPGWRLHKHRWRQPRPGLCAACAYDLRATPDRCPECGTPAATTPA